MALDATYALDPNPSGVARYSDRLIRELSAAGAAMTLCARWPRILRLTRHFRDLRFRACWLQEPLNIRLPHSVDLFHGLNQRLPGYRFRLQVVTVHDVFPLTGEQYSTPEFRARFSRIVRDAVQRADRIVCVSEYTRHQLCAVLGVPASKCVVIHHGVDPAPALSEEQAAAAAQLARQVAGADPYLLTVGAIQVRKNTMAAIDAVARIRTRQPVRLVLAGSAGHGADAIVEHARQHGLGDRVRVTGYVDERTLDALYRNAVALLFPSLEEGFGFPVLEAMARGLPVIASNRSAIPEVAGDAAVLLDPADTEGMARAAERMIDDAAWRERWREAGLEQAARFSWRAAAAATMDVYRQLVG